MVCKALTDLWASKEHCTCNFKQQVNFLQKLFLEVVRKSPACRLQRETIRTSEVLELFSPLQNNYIKDSLGRRPSHWITLFMLFLTKIIPFRLLSKVQFHLECGKCFLPKLTSMVLQPFENMFLTCHKLKKVLNPSLLTSLTERFSKKSYYIATRQFWKH